MSRQVNSSLPYTMPDDTRKSLVPLAKTAVCRVVSGIFPVVPGS